ncbi:hypothetical protein B0H11DRAFT_2245211 [Mycena galericulata]|nr:hypothetical protein B0H11DRAFT_2245211 [Mycena galericulata]
MLSGPAAPHRGGDICLPPRSHNRFPIARAPGCLIRNPGQTALLRFTLRAPPRSPRARRLPAADANRRAERIRNARAIPTRVAEGRGIRGQHEYDPAPGPAPHTRPARRRDFSPPPGPAADHIATGRLRGRHLHGYHQQHDPARRNGDDSTLLSSFLSLQDRVDTGVDIDIRVGLAQRSTFAWEGIKDFGTPRTPSSICRATREHLRNSLDGFLVTPPSLLGSS